MSQTAEVEPLITPAEVCRRLSVPKSTLLDWAKTGKVPVERLSPRVIRFRWSDVVAALGLTKEVTTVTT